MYFSDAVRVLIRRWYVVLVGLLLVAGGVAAALVWVPTQYQSTAHVLLLLPPQSTGARNPTNPYLNLQPGLTTTATLIASDLSTKATQRAVADAGFDSSYAVGVAPDTGPLLVITVEDTDPEMAVATREEVVRQLDLKLSAMQTDMGVPPTQVIFSRWDGTSGGAEVLPGSKIRAAAAIQGVGTALIVLAAFLVDRLAGRRSRRPSADRRPLAAPEKSGVAPPPAAAVATSAKPPRRPVPVASSAKSPPRPKGAEKSAKAPASDAGPSRSSAKEPSRLAVVDQRAQPPVKVARPRRGQAAGGRG